MDKEGQTEVKLLTWRAACRSWERRDAVARSRSRPWISCSSLCPGRGESQGGQVIPLTGLASSQASPGPRQGQEGLYGKLPFPSPDPLWPRLGTFHLHLATLSVPQASARMSLAMIPTHVLSWIPQHSGFSKHSAASWPAMHWPPTSLSCPSPGCTPSLWFIASA